MNKLHIFGGALVGLAVGAVGGYFIAKKQLEQRYQEELREEIAHERAYLNERHKNTLERRIPQTPPGVDDRVHEGPPTQDLEKVLEGLRYGPKTVAVGPPKAHNVFDRTELDSTPPEGQESADQSNENLGLPFVIPEDVWSESMPFYEHVTYTYYQEDDTLADEEDQIVDRVDFLVGDDNLTRFGEKCDDPDTVFIRNKKLRMDFEIVRAHGSYKALVLGE